MRGRYLIEDWNLEKEDEVSLTSLLGICDMDRLSWLGTLEELSLRRSVE